MTLFDWDGHNERHVRDHSVGATEAGRILFIVYTRRGRRLRAVSARDASDREKRRYRKRGK